MSKPAKKEQPATAEKALAPINQTAVAPTAQPVATHAPAALPGESVIASDVLLPRLLLMQSISPLVTKRKAVVGEWRRSTTGELMGGLVKERDVEVHRAIDIVPIRISNTWLNFETIGGKGEYRGTEERTAKNEMLPWDYKGPNGTAWVRKKAVTLYGIIPSDVAAYAAEVTRAIAANESLDLSKTLLPVVITFQSTSFKHAAKKVATFFNAIQMNRRVAPNLQPFGYMLPLTCRPDKNSKGEYMVADFDPPKVLKDTDVFAAASHWSQLLNTTEVHVDDSGQVDEDSGSRATHGGAAEMEV